MVKLKSIYLEGIRYLPPLQIFLASEWKYLYIHSKTDFCLLPNKKDTLGILPRHVLSCLMRLLSTELLTTEIKKLIVYVMLIFYNLCGIRDLHQIYFFLVRNVFLNTIYVILKFLFLVHSLTILTNASNRNHLSFSGKHC